jgi:hypothetical protein
MAGKTKMSRISCLDCGEVSSFPVNSLTVNDPVSRFDEDLVKKDRLVITSVILGQPVRKEHIKMLKSYCKFNNAQLVVIPLKYRTTDEENGVESGLEEYYVTSNFEFKSQYKIMAGMKLNATLENPLAGLDPLSKGSNVIFAHPQVALKTVPVDTGYPGIISTTGCISQKDYSETKTGHKASFNHSYSAIVLETDRDGLVHQRHLNFSDFFVYDLEWVYDAYGERENYGGIEALITGDEHVTFIDPNVVLATYKWNNSIVNTLKPRRIVRHDVIDAYSISHHHKKNVFTKYAKYKDGYDKLQEELDTTIEFILETTPEYAVNIIVSSNHHDHILKWLNETDPKQEPWNAVLYHQLMYLMLEKTSMGESGAEYPNPFELYFNHNYAKHTKTVKFLGRNEQYFINHQVAINAHGDIGSNGVRGSRKSFSGMPTKHVIGHSHSPGIEKGVYQVGTSSRLRLEYNTGPSSWHHCHCIVYPNGKRQLIFIIDGKWRA